MLALGLGLEILPPCLWFLVGWFVCCYSIKNKIKNPVQIISFPDIHTFATQGTKPSPFNFPYRLLF